MLSFGLWRKEAAYGTARFYYDDSAAHLADFSDDYNNTRNYNSDRPVGCTDNHNGNNNYY